MQTEKKTERVPAYTVGMAKQPLEQTLVELCGNENLYRTLWRLSRIVMEHQLAQPLVPDVLSELEADDWQDLLDLGLLLEEVQSAVDVHRAA